MPKLNWRSSLVSLISVHPYLPSFGSILSPFAKLVCSNIPAPCQRCPMVIAFQTGYGSKDLKYLQPATILRPSVWECILHHTKHQFWIHSVLARGSHDALRVSALARWQAWSPLKRFPARTTELARNLQGAEKTHEVLSVFFCQWWVRILIHGWFDVEKLH